MRWVLILAFFLAGCSKSEPQKVELTINVEGQQLKSQAGTDENNRQTLENHKKAAELAAKVVDRLGFTFDSQTAPIVAENNQHTIPAMSPDAGWRASGICYPHGEKELLSEYHVEFDSNWAYLRATITGVNVIRDGKPVPEL